MNWLSIQYKSTKPVHYTYTEPIVYSINGEIRRAASWVAILRELHQLLGVEFENKPRNSDGVVKEIKSLLEEHSSDTKLLLTSSEWLI